MSLKQSEVVFMYDSDDETYDAYGATFSAWGSSRRPEQVARHHARGMRCSAHIWRLTANLKLLMPGQPLRDAVARDIAGQPVVVPWLMDGIAADVSPWFGCTHHPLYLEHTRSLVREYMAGGADALQVDDHLGVAHAAIHFGGGLCDHCMAAFRLWLSDHAPSDRLRDAGVHDLAGFDYRTIVRQFATDRATYLRVRETIPLMDLFERFHLESAAAQVFSLKSLAEEAAGHEVMLSANAGIQERMHHTIVPFVHHLVCEVKQSADRPFILTDEAVQAYRLGEQLGVPMCVTASGLNWALAKAHGAIDVIQFWVALAYAHGQRFMTPHNRNQWCHTPEFGSFNYAAPVESFAPMYRFIREHAAWFDDFVPVDDVDVSAACTSTSKHPGLGRVHVSVRRHDGGGRVAIHLLDRFCGHADTWPRVRDAVDVEVSLPADLLAGLKGEASWLRFDGDAESVTLAAEGNRLTTTLRLEPVWGVLVLA